MEDVIHWITEHKENKHEASHHIGVWRAKED